MIIQIGTTNIINDNVFILNFCFYKSNEIRTKFAFTNNSYAQ